MSIQIQIAAELISRSQALTDEFQFWAQLAENNERRRGIHLSQIRAIGVLLEGLQDEQRTQLTTLSLSMPLDTFTRHQRSIEDELGFLHGVATIFRHILAQRDDERYFRRILDAADLVAAGAFLSCIDLRRTWGGFPDDHYRAPPLCYLNAHPSAVALTRAHTMAMFDFPLDSYNEKALPVPVIGLPFHYTAGIWTLCTIYHEVGHILDHELGLRVPVREALEYHLAEAGVDEARTRRWCGWVSELIADTFGVLLGGEGYACTLVKLLLTDRDEAPDRAAATHPPPYLRLKLLEALLPVSPAATILQALAQIQPLAEALHTPSQEHLPYLHDLPHVVAALLHAPLDAVLCGHCLADFGSLLRDTGEDLAALAQQLRSGERQPVSASFLRSYHLFPISAQCAVSTSTASDTNSLGRKLREIHQVTLELFDDADIVYLDAQLDGELSDGRKSYLREVTAGVVGQGRRQRV